MTGRILVGTAGWSIPRASADRAVGEGTHLERYARVFPCAEINSSFHRPHARETYARWARCTPRRFRFAVKLPRTITHEGALRRARSALERFLDESGGLGSRRGPLLVQLPPSLEFALRTAARFFDLLRSLYKGHVVCEPRHPTWFSPQAEVLLMRNEVGRVAADPAPLESGATPGGWPGLVYYRLHGSPRKYWSRYDPDFVARLASSLNQVAPAIDAWCVFDNTASGAAFENAWELHTLLGGEGKVRGRRRQFRYVDAPSQSGSG